MTNRPNAPDIPLLKLNKPLPTLPLRLVQGATVTPPGGAVKDGALSPSDALKRAGGDLVRATALLNATQGRKLARASSAPANGRAAAARSGTPTSSVAREMAPDTILQPGEEVMSGSGNAKLVYQGDGNLVLYVRRWGVMPTTHPGSGWEARWASNTAGQPAGICAMQGDGNLVLYAPDGTPIWASNTWGHPGAFLVVQDDENVVIYEGGNPIWSTNTWIGGIVRSAFAAGTRGFHFVNNFPDGYWQFGALRFSTAGLCGGMSFSALDYYFAGMSIPSTSTTPSAVNDALGQYINARQQESVVSNLGGWAVQILNPDDHALHYWATHDEWNKLKSAIDAGMPAPIGVGIYLNGGASHQVVALGYREGAQERWVLTYDPNNPNAESYLHLAPGRLHWSDELGGDWRGFFVEGYTPKTPPSIP